jgi:hypothetical protein
MKAGKKVERMVDKKVDTTAALKAEGKVAMKDNNWAAE